MKNLLIALIALTMTLGVGCKKSEVESVKPSTEVKKEVAAAELKLKPSLKAENTQIGVIGGEDAFPHNTGACTCGKYASCYPSEYLVWKWIDADHGQYYIYQTAYGQKTFPEGAIFPGN